MVAAATALVILGGSILPFLTPWYVRLEQDRTGVSALTGYSAPALDEVATSLLADLVLWQGDFDVEVDGQPVLKAVEVGHMRDVRGVFAGFFILVAAGVVVLVVAALRARGMAGSARQRAEVWRHVRGGARGLAIGVAVAGTFAILAFDAAFEVFHRLFFSEGSYTFDPRTDRLVQLFPELFWSETAVAVGVVAILASVATWGLARNRAARMSGAA